MSKSGRILQQQYPRIQDENNRYFGCLDDSQLVNHQSKMPPEQIMQLIRAAIRYANEKSRREIVSLPIGSNTDQIARIYVSEGKKLLRYFRKYCSDPASTAHQVYGKHYTSIGTDQFRNQTLQKERMNSGWRYQYLAVSCAQNSQRFLSVSDIGTAEADFNAVIEYADKSQNPLCLYVSVKNRQNTLGGQDWPKAIAALENVAKNDKNRPGDYCCIFGITIDRGTRYIKQSKKTSSAHSDNTEVWLSDYFWPFFANYTYDEIMGLVLDVLMQDYQVEDLFSQLAVPDELLMAFGKACFEAQLINEQGIFNDPYRLVQFFCKKD